MEYAYLFWYNSSAQNLTALATEGLAELLQHPTLQTYLLTSGPSLKIK